MKIQPWQPRQRDWRVRLGQSAERSAWQWLLLQPGDRRLLARNFRARRGEIDLVVEERGQNGTIELVFIEVRARRQGSWLGGIEAADARKWRRVEEAGQRFLRGYRGTACTVRMDLLVWDGVQWRNFPGVWPA